MGHNIIINLGGRKLESLEMEIIDGEISLPEVVIQHIQSYMTGKEAARTTILSKSWHAAWLTRPVLDFDHRDFSRSRRPRDASLKFMMNTMLRYLNSNLKIESFKLHTNIYYDKYVVPILIYCAMKIGATDVQLEIKLLKPFILPREVLGSKTLIRLSLTRFIVNRNLVSCVKLKSLTLNHVRVTSDDVFKDIILCCILIEELSLSHCTGFALDQKNMFELHKLKSLYLDCQKVDNKFFTRFSSRFPCLGELSILQCHGCTRVRIASTSLQTIRFILVSGSQGGKFDVPNIRKFTYVGEPLVLYIEGASREWELDIYIYCNCFHKNPWLLKLKKLLTKYMLSRISLSLILKSGERSVSEHAVDIEVVPKPLAVENLNFYAPSTFCSALLVRLLGIFRPKFITYCLSAHCDLWSTDIFRERLIALLITCNCENMLGKLGLKKVNVEAYKRFGSEWRPLVLEELEASITPSKIRLQFIWEETSAAAAVSLPL